MIPEDYTPQKGLNSIFSELLNYELVQNPYEEGFLGSEATLKKRAGLFTEQGVGGVYTWQTDGTIKGKIVVGGVSFFRDDDCNVYRFEKISGDYTMTQVFVNPPLPDPGHLTLFTTNLYGKRVKQKAITLSYLSVFQNLWTADKVISTNDDGNGNVVLAVNEVGTFAATDVGKYIYFTEQASSNVKYQIRQIVEFIDDKTVYLGEMFYAEPSTWEPDESGETYETIDSIVVFNNLRNSAGLVLCIDVTNNDYSFRNFGGNDIEFFEGRLWQISGYGTSIGGSLASGEYEILDPTTVLGSSSSLTGQKMDSFIPTQNYLLVNQENSMSVIWQIGSNNNIAPIYNFNSISSGESAFGPDSIFYKGGLYFLAKDRIFNGGNIIPISANIIGLDVKNQGIIIENFLNRIKGEDYVRCYDFGRGKIIQHTDGVKTYMVVYDSIYEGRLLREYNLVIEDKWEMFYDDLLIGVGNKICLKRGDNDLGEDISVKCVIVGSKQVKNSLFALLKLKLTLGYFGNAVKFKMRLDLGNQVFSSKIEKDGNGLEYITWQNVGGIGNSLGSIPLGMNGLGGNNSVNDYIAKIGLIGIPIGRKCTYYKFTLENIDNYDLNIVSITALIETGNPYITPIQNTM